MTLAFGVMRHCTRSAIEIAVNEIRLTDIFYKKTTFALF